MKFDGMNFRRVKHVFFRNGRDGERDGEGNPVESCYAAFVYAKDCPKNEDGRFVPRLADKRIPGVYSLTNMMYGKQRKVTNHFGKWINVRREDGSVTQKLATEYYSTPVYLALDGRVYMTSIASLTKHGDF